MKVRKIITIATLIAISNIFSGCAKSNAHDTNFTQNVSSKADTQSEVTSSIDGNDTKNITSTESEKALTKSTDKSVDTPSEANYDLPPTIIPTISADNTNSSSIQSNENDTHNLDGIKQLPQSILNTVEYYESAYPNMHIGVGLYSLDGTVGYEYSSNMPNNKTFNSACTVKAAYALYVLQTAEKKGVDIWSTYIDYDPNRHYDSGSGVIINYIDQCNPSYCIGDLVYLLLSVSDNIAFNMLTDYYPISGFYQYIIPLGGESDMLKWGRASIQQRKCEWVAINSYINGGNLYSETLRNDLSGTDYAYLVWGMTGCYSYMQKSGWTDEDFDYPAAGDCAIINDQYILIVMTEDYSYGSGHIDAIIGVGSAVESFIYENDGVIF